MRRLFCRWEQTEPFLWIKCLRQRRTSLRLGRLQWGFWLCFRWLVQDWLHTFRGWNRLEWRSFCFNFTFDFSLGLVRHRHLFICRLLIIIVFPSLRPCIRLILITLLCRCLIIIFIDGLRFLILMKKKLKFINMKNFKTF